MELKRMLAMISDLLDKWPQITIADVHTLKVEENGMHGGVDIHIGYFLKQPTGTLDLYKVTIQVPPGGQEPVYGNPERE